MRMRTFFGLAPVFAAVLAVAGCYASEKPMISAAESDHGYRRIIYVAEGSTTNNIVLERANGSYRLVGGQQGEEIRFKRLSTDIYVAQFKTKSGGRDAYLYGLLRVDQRSGSVKSYASIFKSSNALPAGFLSCFERWICFEKFATYTDLALKLVKAQATPDTTYKIIKLE
jgi:hypothetical protein